VEENHGMRACIKIPKPGEEGMITGEVVEEKGGVL
jgi:hypothetical protein